MTNDRSLDRLARLIRIPTISRPDAADTDWAAFSALRDALQEQFPLAHKRLEREVVAEHTLLMRWPGTDPTLPPAILMAHQDVVDPGDVASWAHDPFGAEIIDGVMHGRGTIDDKGSLVAILEAVEGLIATGFAPQRDVILVFGHDEETNGTGAKAAAAVLAERGIAPAFVLDEGGAIVEGVLPGLSRPVAVVGLSEKGVGSFRLRVAETGGHSSTPPPLSAIGRLARAITRIDAKPFPASLTEPTRKMFAAAGQAADGRYGWLYRNIGWTAPILRAALIRGGPETAAMTRTTRVTTMINGGHAQNAIPERAEAIVNCRILPGETIESVIAHLRAAIDDPIVEVGVVQGWDPAPISPTEGYGWDLIGEILAEQQPDVVRLPYTQNGATDSRSFTGLTRAVYRFAPFHLTSAERGALHAIDEQLRVSSWLAGVEFYSAMIRRL